MKYKLIFQQKIKKFKMEAIVLDRCDGINGVIELKAINLVTGNNDHRKNDLRLQKMPEEVIISGKNIIF